MIEYFGFCLFCLKNDQQSGLSYFHKWKTITELIL